MTSEAEPLEVNGETPLHFVGRLCESLICRQYRYKGDLVEFSNVAYLKFGGEWQRLYFDCGIIFWRRGTESPRSFVEPETQADHPIVNVGLEHGLIGKRLTDIALRTIASGSEVVLSFSCGSSVRFGNINDITTFSVAGSCTMMPRSAG